MASQVIMKAELARELGFSRARISQLCQKGLPVRPDGKLNRAEALAWVQENNSSWRGGWGYSTVQDGRRQRTPMPEAAIPDDTDLEQFLAELGDYAENTLKELLESLPDE